MWTTSCSCSLAVLDPRVGNTMDVLSPFIPVLCHSDWLVDGESCPRLYVVHQQLVWCKFAKQPGIKPITFRLWVQCPNHYTNMPQSLKCRSLKNENSDTSSRWTATRGLVTSQDDDPQWEGLPTALPAAAVASLVELATEPTELAEPWP